MEDSQRTTNSNSQGNQPRKRRTFSPRKGFGNKPAGDKDQSNKPGGQRSRNRQSSNRSRGPRNQRPGGPRNKPGAGPNRGGGGRGRRGGFKRRPDKAPALTHRLSQTDEKAPVIPEITDEDTVRIITVSGVEEIGRNMNIVETKDDIIVIDAGFQFVSAEAKAPGVNYILPNTQYLEERKHKIRALLITHGHLDHIGGLPFIIERIGNPPIYTQYLSSLMILKRQEEFPHIEPLNMNVVKEGEHFTVGNTKIKTFAVTHSIPDAMGIAIETKHGDVVATGDVKLTHVNGKVDEQEAKEWLDVGKNNNLAMLCDSTNAWQEGFSSPESIVLDTFDELVKNSTGRLIIGTFASNFERLFALIESCERYGKKVVLEGRSMKTNIEIAIHAKLLEVKPDTFIQAGDMGDYPSDKIVILSTGAQGEEFAALMRMSTDKHKFITLNERDTIVLSSSVIPGNEISVQILKDNIYRKNVKVVTVQSAAIHSTGHGYAGELTWIRQQVNPKFLIPVHGHHFMLKSHYFNAVENGFPKENVVVPDTGTIIDIKNGTELIRQPMTIPNEQLMVDGFTVGTRQEVVLRDRQTLAEDGMFVVIATVNSKTGKLRKSPDIISRGFVYLRENQQLLSEARVLVKRTIEKHTERMHPLDLEYVKEQVSDTLSGFLMQKTNKTPMVIPVLIGI